MFGIAPIDERANSDLPSLLKAQSGYLALAVILNMLILSLFQGLAAIIVPPIWQLGLLSRGSLELIQELFTLAVYLCAFLPPYFWYAKSVGYSPRAIVHDAPYAPVLAAAVGIALGVSVAGMFLTIIVSIFFAMFGLLPMDLTMVFPESPPALALYLLNLTVLPALIEEFIMRGVVMGSLRRYGDRFAIVISALVFALLHRNMTQLPNAFLLGLTLGYFVIKTNSIWTGVAIHFINNLFAVLLSAFAVAMGDMQAMLAQGIVMLAYVAAAIGGLIYLRVLRRVDMSLRPSSCPLRPAAFYRQFLVHFPMMLLLLLMTWMIFFNFS